MPEPAIPARTRSVHLETGGERHGQQPVCGTAGLGVGKQDKSYKGSVDTTQRRSGPQKVKRRNGERPIGAAKVKQSDTEALCQPPPPLPFVQATPLSWVMQYNAEVSEPRRRKGGTLIKSIGRLDQCVLQLRRVDTCATVENARVVLEGDDHLRFMAKQHLRPSNTRQWLLQFSIAPSIFAPWILVVNFSIGLSVCYVCCVITWFCDAWRSCFVSRKLIGA